MSADYAGNPSSNPATITVPDDGDIPAGTLFGEPYEQLADRTAFNAANFTAHDSAQSTLRYEQARNQAVVSLIDQGANVGARPVARVNGESIVVSSALVHRYGLGAMHATETVPFSTVFSAITNGSSLVVVGSDDAGTTNEIRLSTDNGATFAAAYGSPDNIKPGQRLVTYEPNTGFFVICDSVSSNVYRSTTGATGSWSAAIDSGLGDSPTDIVVDGAGTVVTIGEKGGTSDIYFSRSTNGGVDWTATEFTSDSVGIVKTEGLAYDAIRDSWFLLARDPDPSPDTVWIYTSPDGSAWTVVAEFDFTPDTDSAAFSVGGAWVFMTSIGDSLVTSIDAGVSWQEYKTPLSLTDIAFDGSRFMVLTATNTYTGAVEV